MENEYIEYFYMVVSKNNGTPKSSTLIGFPLINHPFWGTPIFGNTHICQTAKIPSNRSDLVGVQPPSNCHLLVV